MANVKFGLNDASRIVDVIDSRIGRHTKSASKVEHAWGVIATVAADGLTASAYLNGETDGAYISQGFRVKPPMYPTVGDKVRVAMDYGNGERWIEEINPTGAYHRITIEPSTGEVEFGSGSADKDSRLYRTGTKTLTVDDHAGGAATLNVVGNIKQGGVQVALVSDIPSVPAASGTVTAETAYGSSSAAGSASTYSKGDHTHGTPALPTSSGAGFTVPSGDLAVSAGTISASGNISSTAGNISTTAGDITASGKLTATGGTLVLSTDARVYRSAVKTITLDDNAGAALTKVAIVGAAPLEFGGDARIARTATETLKFTDASGTTLVALDFMGALERGFSGTSFPASPTTNDRFFRTDLGLEFYYNGTRWVSATLFTAPMWPREDVATFGDNVSAMSATSSPTRGSMPLATGWSDVWVVDHVTVFQVATGGSGLSASHKWVGAWKWYDSAQADLGTKATVNIDSGSSATWRRIVVTVGALGTSAFMLQTSWTKTGTPGNLMGSEMFTYRVVAT